MSILSILNEIASTSKRTEKEKILLREKNNEELKNTFWAAYNPDITWWISKHPQILNYTTEEAFTLSFSIKLMLDNVASRKVTGNSAIETYQNILSSLNKDDIEVLKRIIDRDLRCGVSVATINKTWKGLIPTYKFMLAETDPKNLVYPLQVETKVDGLRTHITKTFNNEIIIRTRNGNRITSLECMYDDLKKVIPIGETFDGELVCYENNIPMERKVSNGIMNKAMRNTISLEEAKKVVFIVWDIVDYNQLLSQRTRFMYLINCLGSNDICVKLIKNQIANNYQDIELFFNQAIERGEEGVIAKNIDAKWQPKRTFDLVKFKAEKTADLIVVGWEKGTGRNQDRLGALICESSDGKIRVNVGTGFTDFQREKFTKEMMLEKIVEVLYNSKISKKSSDVGSLYLPRYIRIRADKDEANSSEEIL